MKKLKTYKRKCPICENKSEPQLAYYDIDDFDGTSFSGQVKLMSCKNCGFVFNDSDDGASAYDSYYENESFYFTDTSFGTGGTTDFDRNRYALYLKILEQHKVASNMFVVDIGCGKGGLLSFFLEKGFNKLAGVEIDQRLVNKAHAIGLNVKKGSATNLPDFDEKIDMFCLSHLLEHIYDLEDAIEMIKYQLKDNGLVFIEVPDASRYSAGQVFEFYWLAMREHVNHFDPWHLEMLMSKHGFKKESMLQSMVSYDDDYGYPSLIMLFRKVTIVSSDFIFNPDLIESIKIYISKENESLDHKKRIIEKLIGNQKEVSVWGIALEFFILYSMTSLRKCNIQYLIDKNPIKQTKKVDGILINPPEILNDLSDDAVVLITSVFRKKEMLTHLKQIGFGGEIIVLA